TTPAPPTDTVRVAFGPIGPPPALVSRMRAGVMPVKTLPPAVLLASVNQPPTSATASVLPVRLKLVTLPAVPTLTTTRLGTVCPARKLRLDAVGRVVPVGKTVR